MCPPYAEQKKIIPIFNICLYIHIGRWRVHCNRSMNKHFGHLRLVIKTRWTSTNGFLRSIWHWQCTKSCSTANCLCSNRLNAESFLVLHLHLRPFDSPLFWEAFMNKTSCWQLFNPHVLFILKVARKKTFHYSLISRMKDFCFHLISLLWIWRSAEHWYRCVLRWNLILQVFIVCAEISVSLGILVCWQCLSWC